MAGFDFAAHLGELYSQNEFDIEFLSGGLVNFTVRARRRGSNVITRDAPATLVLKQAPPYVAAIGAAAPFSQQRQLVEGAVLELFSDGGPLEHLITDVRVPRVVGHDKTNFVLILEDLGPLVTLWDCLTPAALSKTTLDHKTVIRRCADIGRRVGHFFADLHAARNIEEIHKSVDEVAVKLLETSMSKDVIREAAVQPVLSRLQDYGGIELATAKTLYGRVERDFERAPYSGETCFSMGDFHPGCVLVSPPEDWQSSTGPVVDVGIIDWEFAGLSGRGVNGDMAQCLASLHCLLMSLPQGSPTYEAVWSVMDAMCTSYAGAANLPAKMADRSPTNSVVSIFRSALILLGRETINQAIDREWGSAGELVERMIQAGAWYVERAGEDVEDMLRGGNWDELSREKVGIISRLFGL